MRVIIIPVDGYVSVDGRGFSGLDLSAIDPQIHAVQWYGTGGEMELVPDENGRGANIEITNLDFVEPALDAWQIAADDADTVQPLSVADVANNKLAELSSACRTHIISGVVSNALGADHTYPTNNTAEHPDQQNLNGCVTESLLNDADPSWSVPFWCADNGKWDRRDHTHAQIRAVGAAVARHVRSAQDTLKQLHGQIEAITADAVMADDEKRAAIAKVVWPGPTG